MMALQNLATSLAWDFKVEDHGILIHFAIGHQSTSGMSQRELQVARRVEITRCRGIARPRTRMLFVCQGSDDARVVTRVPMPAIIWGEHCKHVITKKSTFTRDGARVITTVPQTNFKNNANKSSRRNTHRVTLVADHMQVGHQMK